MSHWLYVYIYIYIYTHISISPLKEPFKGEPRMRDGQPWQVVFALRTAAGPGAGRPPAQAWTLRAWGWTSGSIWLGCQNYGLFGPNL